MSKIVVIGSANMDTTIYLNTAFPGNFTGECTNGADKMTRNLGGKGANQARATKLQSPQDEVYFIGCVGQDDEGVSIIEEFQKVGINYSGVKVLPGMKTDGRIINVDKDGNNRMMGYGSAIKQLSPEMVASMESILEGADIVAIQLKMPPETVKFVIEYCEKHNLKLLIDPTPLDKSAILAENAGALLSQAEFLTPNEEEAFALALYLEGKTLEEVKALFDSTPKEKRVEIIKDLVEKHPNVIATMGGDGVIYSNNGQVILKPTYPTVCKDSTGAGDTFNGAFIAAIARGENLENAIKYGLMASSEKVRFEGAQNGVPDYEKTRKLLDEAEKNQKSPNDDDDEPLH